MIYLVSFVKFYYQRVLIRNVEDQLVASKGQIIALKKKLEEAKKAREEAEKARYQAE